MSNQAKRTSRAMFWLGVTVFVLGAVASALYGHRDGERLFLCSAVVLAIAWLIERRSDG
ncbi:hypothetical protein GA0115233_104940 [Streptomyces sp. DI166]|uniref:hypothetical protein n=1 Tax=unclassified Streptomyces TaxID=2593676 RepID=UPI0007F3DF71|nr:MULTISPECIES: hypothetical protein [unclassified Streptomyces]SBT92705.1 hypothetical protein GA0115233_104940 [Streptomyces sp. DI166]